MIHLLTQTVSVTCETARVLHGRAEDIAFRAQHIANAIRNGFPVHDRLFGDDLQLFNKSLKQFEGAILELPNLLAQLERAAHPEQTCIRALQSLLRALAALKGEMRSLQMAASLAHQHIRNTAFKVESTYVGMEIEKLTQRTDLLPQSCSKILLVVGAGIG